MLREDQQRLQAHLLHGKGIRGEGLAIAIRV